VVTGARGLWASSQLTGVDQKSRTVLSRALRQCSLSTEVMESNASAGGVHSCPHICRIAAILPFPRLLLEEASVSEFRKKLLSISDVTHLNRDGPKRL
jgi:hypothetical protein